MRELGEHGPALHAALAPPVREAQVDRLILIGEEMAPLADAVAAEIQTERVATVEQATSALLHILRPGDVVLVKASNSVGLAKLVEQVAQKVGSAACST
jgi:UDP-N-acetylmuramyl pentapeptide synthase